MIIANQGTSLVQMADSPVTDEFIVRTTKLVGQDFAAHMPNHLVLDRLHRDPGLDLVASG